MERMLKPADLADLLQVPEATLTDWRYHRTGPPFVKVGNQVRYWPADVAVWLKRQRVETT